MNIRKLVVVSIFVLTTGIILYSIGYSGYLKESNNTALPRYFQIDKQELLELSTNQVADITVSILNGEKETRIYGKEMVEKYDELVLYLSICFFAVLCVFGGLAWKDSNKCLQSDAKKRRA